MRKVELIAACVIFGLLGLVGLVGLFMGAWWHLITLVGSVLIITVEAKEYAGTGK